MESDRSFVYRIDNFGYRVDEYFIEWAGAPLIGAVSTLDELEISLGVNMTKCMFLLILLLLLFSSPCSATVDFWLSFHRTCSSDTLADHSLLHRATLIKCIIGFVCKFLIAQKIFINLHHLLRLPCETDFFFRRIVATETGFLLLLQL